MFGCSDCGFGFAGFSAFQHHPHPTSQEITLLPLLTFTQDYHWNNFVILQGAITSPAPVNEKEHFIPEIELPYSEQQIYQPVYISAEIEEKKEWLDLNMYMKTFFTV